MLISLSPRIELTFVSPKGERTQVKGRIGDSILDVARKYNYPLDGMDPARFPLLLSLPL